MKLLEIKNLSKNFGDFSALARLNFTIDEGEIVGLVGPNGAGKTTLFNIISGCLKPSGGKVIFNGKDISGFKSHKICHGGIGRTFQSSRPFANMSTFNNVLAGHVFGKEFFLWNRPQDMQTATELLDVVGIAHKSELPAGDLTLSEQRRLGLARVLATRPRLLLLDEVAAGFSPVLVKQSVDLINRVRDRGVTLLVIDHFLSLSLKVSDRLFALDHGKKIAEGPPAKVMKNREVIRAYLGLRRD